MHNFRNLIVWKQAMDLCSELFKISRSFPKDERFGLTAQIMRCAVSIPSNIAEGSGRRTNRDFCHFLTISLGSSFELETQVLLARNFDYITEHTLLDIQRKNSEIQRMLYGFQKTLTSPKSEQPNS